MSKLIIIFSTLVLFNTISHTQWLERRNGLPEDWYPNASTISTCDSLTAVVGLNNPEDWNPINKIFRTTDAGLNWQELPLPIDTLKADIWDISIIDKDHIWFCTASVTYYSINTAAIYATTNGGNTWVKQFEDTTFFNYLKMFDLNNGIAMGDASSGNDPALFLKTTNGGNNWISMNNNFFMGTFSVRKWIDFVNPDIGYFIPATGTPSQSIYKTTDGGASWQLTNYPNIGPPKGIKFYDENYGLTAYTEKMYRTTDGGDSWDSLAAPSFLGCTHVDIEFLENTPSKIWYLGIYNLYFSDDSANTWQHQPMGQEFYSGDIEFADQKHGWALHHNTVYYTKNGDQGVITTVENDIFPTAYFLSHNYPNPFNPTTIIKYQIPELSFVTLKVYDVLGNEIATLVNEEKTAGSYKVEFSTIGGPESSIRHPASGVYFYQLRAGDFVQSKKMVLLK